MDISTKSSHEYVVNLNVIDIGENAYPAAQRGLQDLERAVARLVDQKTMQFVETHLLQLHERVRRLFSHFGAVRALAAGHLWPQLSYDATNVVYASVWELWKLEERSERFPYCRSITNVKSAGNIVEALLGIAWICRHEPQGSFMCQCQWILKDKSQQDSAGYHGSFFQVYRSFGAIAPNLGAIASKFGAIAPNLGATAPNLCAIAPKFGAIAPNVGAIAPNLGATAPNLCAIAPKFGAIAPNVGAIAPNLGAKAPNLRAISPKIGAKAQRYRAITPNLYDKAPNLGSK